jgi:hypothetical protein
LLSAYSGRFEEARLDVNAAEDLAISIRDQILVAASCWPSSAEIELIADNAERPTELAEKMLSTDIVPPLGEFVAMSGLGILAEARFLLGQRDEATESAKELLNRARFALPRLSPDAILVLAAVGANSSALGAAHLLGFGDESCRRNERPLSQTDARIRAMLVRALSSQLPADALKRASTAGKNLTLKDAAELALSLN